MAPRMVPDAATRLCVVCVQINRYAFSGGQRTKELHEELGANLEVLARLCMASMFSKVGRMTRIAMQVDVAYQYLTYFLEDDDELKRVCGCFQCAHHFCV